MPNHRASSAPFVRNAEPTFFDALTGMSWTRPDPFLCFAEPGGGGEPGGGDPPKTFTQEDVDPIVTQRLAIESRKFADYDEIKERAAKVDELEKSLAEKLELAGKNEEEKQKLLTSGGNPATEEGEAGPAPEAMHGAADGFGGSDLDGASEG